MVIGTAFAAITVVHPSGDTSINTLTSDASIDLAGGSLTLAGNSTINGVFRHSGNLNLQSGRLVLTGGGSSVGGDFVAAAGSELVFSAADNPNLPITYTLDADSSITSAGVVSLGVDVFGHGISAAVATAGPYNVTGSTYVRGNVDFAGSVASVGSFLTIDRGTANFHGAFITTPNLGLNGTLLAGDVTITQHIDWSGGTMGGPGTTTVPADVVVEILGEAGSQRLDGRTLNNYGSVIWTGSAGCCAGFSLQNGATLNNYGSFQVQGRQIMNGSVAEEFNNWGTLAVDAGKLLRVGPAFNNQAALLNTDPSPQVHVRTGATLVLTGGGSSTHGEFIAEAGSELVFSAADNPNLPITYTLDADSSITSAGVVSLGVDVFGHGISAAVATAGPYNVTGSTHIRGNVDFTGSVASVGTSLTVDRGTANFHGAFITTPYVALSGTLLAGDVTVSQLLEWREGRMGGAGTTFVEATGRLEILSGAGKTLDARTLHNTGSATWTAEGNITLSNGAVFDNGGTLAVSNQLACGGRFDESLIRRIVGTGGAVFRNSGTFVKSGGRIEFNGVAVTNSGTIDLTQCALRFDSGLVQTGGSTKLTGGEAEASGAFDIQGGTVSGSGTITAAVSNAGGVFAPGTSPGIITVSGSYTQGSAGGLNIEIGGLTPGTDPGHHDQLSVAGSPGSVSVTLAGALNVSLVDGFQPALGDQFVIVANDGADAVVGTFDNSLITIGPIVFQASYEGTTDDPGHNDVALTVISVNAPPEITSFTSSSPGCGGVAEGQEVMVSGTFTDPNASDTHTGVINWGDGTAPTAATITESGGTGTVSASHVYADGGIYTVTVTLSDGSESDIATAPAVIAGAGFDGASGVLEVVGTDLADNVTVSMQDASTFKVIASFLATAGNQKTFPAAGVGKLLVLLCGGNDQATVSSGISITAQMDGGMGNDHLKGGSGHDIVLGGEGDDLLVGGSGRDLMIGGNGADRIVGDPDDDILIAGTTALDNNDTALAAILAEWTSARDYATRTANIRGEGTGIDYENRLNLDFFLKADGPDATVSDDGAKDVMTGSAGQDWFFANLDSGVLDKITDLSAEEFANDLDFIFTDV